MTFTAPTITINRVIQHKPLTSYIHIMLPNYMTHIRLEFENIKDKFSQDVAHILR